MYPTILSLPDGSDLIIEQTPTTLEIRLSIPTPEQRDKLSAKPTEEAEVTYVSRHDTSEHHSKQ